MVPKRNGRYELVVQSEAPAKKKSGANGFAPAEVMLLGSGTPFAAGEYLNRNFRAPSRTGLYPSSFAASSA